MSCERENKYWNEKTFHFLDCAMATELMSTALLFEFRFVSLQKSCFVVLQALLANF